MGRDKSNEQNREHWTKLTRHMMEVPAWRAMTPYAQALYPWLKLEWKGPKANNNGKLSLSVRQAADRLGCSRERAAKAFVELQEKGFIACTSPATLGLGGSAKSPTFELTEIPLPASDSYQGRRLYNDWRKGRDYPVTRAPVQNPHGLNGSSSKTVSERGNVVALKGSA